MSKFPPVGMIEIFGNINNGSCVSIVGEENFKFLKKSRNYDCTVECPGHMTYMECCNLILDKVPYAH